MVSNAVAVLTEINEETGTNIIAISPQILNQLMTAMNECNEWGQIFILDSLAKYKPSSTREAQSICDRVVTRLNHANASVVLTSIKVLLKFVNYIDNKDYINTIYGKVSAPLGKDATIVFFFFKPHTKKVTQLSEEPEIVYVALRNIGLILRKNPTILSQVPAPYF